MAYRGARGGGHTVGRRSAPAAEATMDFESSVVPITKDLVLQQPVFPFWSENRSEVADDDIRTPLGLLRQAKFLNYDQGSRCLIDASVKKGPMSAASSQSSQYYSEADRNVALNEADKTKKELEELFKIGSRNNTRRRRLRIVVKKEKRQPLLQAGESYFFYKNRGGSSYSPDGFTREEAVAAASSIYKANLDIFKIFVVNIDHRAGPRLREQGISANLKLTVDEGVIINTPSGYSAVKTAFHKPRNRPRKVPGDSTQASQNSNKTPRSVPDAKMSSKRAQRRRRRRQARKAQEPDEQPRQEAKPRRRRRGKRSSEPLEQD